MVLEGGGGGGGGGGVIAILTWQVIKFYKYELLFTILGQNCQDNYNGWL